MYLKQNVAQNEFAETLYLLKVKHRLGATLKIRAKSKKSTCCLDRNIMFKGLKCQTEGLVKLTKEISTNPALIFFASTNTSFKKLLSLDKHVKTKNIRINFWKNIPIIKKLNQG